MTKTLKERADEALKINDYDTCDVATVDLRLSSYEYHLINQGEEVLQLVKDQQAMIEELEAEIATKMVRHHFHAPEWKPIAEMPEELKDGKALLFMEKLDNKHKHYDVGFCQGEDIFCKTTIMPTHYMEIPE